MIFEDLKLNKFYNIFYNILKGLPVINLKMEKVKNHSPTFVPRKCSFSNQILTSKDYSSIQISIALANKKGIFSGKNKMYALAGIIRKKGYSDTALNYLTENSD